MFWMGALAAGVLAVSTFVAGGLLITMSRPACIVVAPGELATTGEGAD